MFFKNSTRIILPHDAYLIFAACSTTNSYFKLVSITTVSSLNAPCMLILKSSMLQL